MTYVSVVVQLVVGELELVERCDLLHPLRPLGGGVWVDVDARGRVGVRLARHDPRGAATEGKWRITNYLAY